MTTHIDLNDGAKLFWGSPADARAVIALWETSLDKAPAHVGLNDLSSYARAWLTAQAVKVDVLCFLHSVWKAVWMQHENCASALSLEEIGAVGYADDPAIEWVTGGDEDGSDRAFYGVIRVRSGDHVACAVGLTDEGSLSIWATSEASTWGVAADKLKDIWREDGDESCLYARHIAEIAGDRLAIEDARSRVSALLASLR